MINLQESEAEQRSGEVPREVKGVIQAGCEWNLTLFGRVFELLCSPKLFDAIFHCAYASAHVI